jgi:hypothetical protein
MAFIDNTYRFLLFFLLSNGTALRHFIPICLVKFYGFLVGWV